MNKMTNQNVNPAIVELVQMGNGFGGTKITGNSPEETKRNLRRAFEAAKERMKRDATT
ncbi:TPA: hypothetical protein U9I93_003313 [Acinetobacter baumannii]|uniref:hypothetical protein n=1 Tax=Acinetobacter baumannii TaxID=470 RepID=UPI0002CD9407|nr:hypothetical protein [Acinetobacter baumannii]ENW32619.1 hypothetical protein F922_03928 [Acinetobacter baumannii NIPH 201]MCT9480186.1 hypothetical protein [Acinetobacter baumannii]MDC4535748.1 hypothetical protein [Acinetobacter baumannii]BBT51022.1 hypothetical protein WP8W18E11_P11170 [Acinetobacter baumannii]HCA5151178.1 hypothetical protein [Acinetobacter baumannii]